MCFRLFAEAIMALVLGKKFGEFNYWESFSCASMTCLQLFYKGMMRDVFYSNCVVLCTIIHYNTRVVFFNFRNTPPNPPRHARQGALTFIPCPLHGEETGRHATQIEILFPALLKQLHLNLKRSPTLSQCYI